MSVYQMISDIAMAGAIVFILFISVKQGFIKSFFKYTKIILVIALTIALSSYFIEACKELFVRELFEGRISSALVYRAESSAEALDFNALMETLPKPALNLLPMDAIKGYFDSLTGSGTEVAFAIGTKVEGFLINTVSKAIAYVGTFIISYIVCSIAIYLLDRSCKISFLNRLNKLMGFIWGLAHSYVFVSTAVCAVMLIFGGDFIEKTFFTRLIYKYGLFTH